MRTSHSRFYSGRIACLEGIVEELHKNMSDMQVQILNLSGFMRNRSEMETAQHEIDEFSSRDLINVVDAGQPASKLSKHVSIQ